MYTFDEETGEWVDTGEVSGNENADTGLITYDPSLIHTDTEVTEITNPALPGQEGYGWRYFSDGTVMSPTGQYYKGTDTSSPTLIYDPNKMTGSDLLGKVFSGTVSAKDLSNYLTNNPKQVAGIIGGLAGAFGNLTPNVQKVGYQGGIPKLTAVNAPIKYAADPNRRPGSGGRQYFTDTTYVPSSDTAAIAAAQAAAAEKAKGIAAAYQPAVPEVNKYAPGSATPAVAMPWNKTVTTPKQENIGAQELQNFLQNYQQSKSLTPTDSGSGGGMAHGGLAALARGRYLQGSTDGMADKLPASIDNKEPAKLSHGEFVVPADVVSHLGNGNSDAGAKKLYQMMDKIRMARTGSKKQGKQINPDKYMPGGVVGYASGGGIKGYETGGAIDTTIKPTYESNLSNWAGPYVTGMLAKGAAEAAKPYESYMGQLTAGPSDLEKQAFTGASSIASTGLTPTTYTGGTWNAAEAVKYMNPYLKSVLDPQVEELRRQSQINLQPTLAKLTQAGSYGGGRQAIIESEAMRNLMQEQNKTIGAGFKSAYDSAMDAYNKGRVQQLEVEKAQQQANEASANFGIKSLGTLADLGKTQREIEQAGLTADKAQFEEQRDYDKKMAQYMQTLLTGLPLATQGTTTAQPNAVQGAAAGADTVIKLLTSLGLIK